MHKIIILPVVLYMCEIWFLTLREEHRLRVSEKRVLRMIFMPRSEEVTEGWRGLHNEELHDWYSFPSKFNRSFIHLFIFHKSWPGYKNHGYGTSQK
jgi:hypothetical protein